MSEAPHLDGPPADVPRIDVEGLERQLADLAVVDGEAFEVILRLAEVVHPGRAGLGDRERVVGLGDGDGPRSPGVANLVPAGGEGERAARERDRLAANAKRSEARFRSLVEQLPAVVFSAALGEGDNEIYISPQIETLLGFTQEEWLNNPLLWYSQLHPDDHDVVIAAFTKGVQTGMPFRAEVRFIAHGGDEVWILGEARLIRDDAGRLAYFQGVAFDITPTKRAQQMMAEAAQLRAEVYAARNIELTELNEQLRVAIEQAEAAEALQRQLLVREREVVERLTQLDSDKNDFVSSVSHELRTPVTSMLGYLEMLGDGDAGPLNDEQMRMLEVVGRNSRRLMSRIEDLLTVSGIEAGKLRLAASPLSIPEMIESAVAAVGPAMAGRRLTVTVDVADDATTITADPEKLDRVLINLLSNAVKFTPDGGRITVTVTRRRDTIVLVVADTGVGIPVDEQARVFERFFRSSLAQEMAVAGTGLGLVIVKGIVELHGGTVALRSVPGVGTEVTITLPA